MITRAEIIKRMAIAAAMVAGLMICGFAESISM